MSQQQEMPFGCLGPECYLFDPATGEHRGTHENDVAILPESVRDRVLGNAAAMLSPGDFQVVAMWAASHDAWSASLTGVPTEPGAPDPKWLTIREARELPRDHPGLWTCVCGMGWMGEAGGYPDDLRSHAAFRVSGGEDGAAHDPGLAQFRPDTVLASRPVPAPEPSARLREAAQAVIAQAETDDDFDGQYVDYLVPFAAMDALRAALAATPQDPEA